MSVVNITILSLELRYLADGGAPTTKKKAPRRCPGATMSYMYVFNLEESKPNR
jgi:hypothetical protein